MMMFASIKVFNGKNRQAFEDWINEINQACRVSDQDFRTEDLQEINRSWYDKWYCPVMSLQMMN